MAKRILVDQPKSHGADHVFCVPGESYLAVLDALYDAPQIRTITCWQEGNAAMMAEVCMESSPTAPASAW
jgi:acetolactate synthase-1/2/3 large subunit|tara:strand:- start:6773 stop:6982 length:210 start_codon:yes stop_codon:yes gene_type:complete